MTRLHPFTLLALAAALPAFAWILPVPVGAAGTLAIALTLALLTPGVSRGMSVIRTALFTAAPFWIFLLLLHDRATTLAIGLRLTTMIVSLLWVVAILPPARVVEAMVAAGWPVSAAYLFSATLSAVPALRERARRLVDAQRCRGLATRGGVGIRMRALRALALPLVLSALHEVDERALALETRGLVAGARRTPLAPPRDRAPERAVRWALVAATLALLVWRIVWRG
ncbi:MAG TPA: energy-coupling factor transporter transmembrane component T [Gemmatimonadales bacterium]